MKKIGIITSGGDCGGLNGVVKGAAQMAHKEGMSAHVIPNELVLLLEISKRRQGRSIVKLGASGDALAGSENDKCIDDRGFGSFMDFRALPKRLRRASYEPFEASSGSSWGSPDRFLVA